MVDSDPQATQHDLPRAIAAELHDAGFFDAREIGRGGFSIVYRCRQRSLDRTVAVKVLIGDYGEADRERFAREQRAMGRLAEHPNIVSIFQAGITATGRPYTVMQYHALNSLDYLIRSSGPTGWAEALRLGIRTAGALETAHRLGVLHRDVKPANILFSDSGEPQLTDFGIAHVAGAFATTTGTARGTPAFIAPELLTGSPPTVASDLYSLGATLFCAITGHAAFERRNGEQLMAQFVRITTERNPRLTGHDIPADVSAIVERAMATDPKDRPATIAVFGEELIQAQRRHNLPLDSMTILAGPSSPWADETPSGHITDDEGLASQLPPTSTPTASVSQTDLGRSADQSSPESAVRLPVRTITVNIPEELTSFVGRRSEITQVRKLMTDSRLVTLTGIGGVGKTRLALRIAAASRRAFSDGVWFVELGELQDETLIAQIIATALGVADQRQTSDVATLATYLAHRRLLLVLDNCEHLVDAVAMLAKDLLSSCPRLQIVATSREPLAVGGEATFRVPPLALPEPGQNSAHQTAGRYGAVELFVDRAGAAVPDYVFTDENMAVVTEICQRLEGLPLPIELAAVRLRAMSVSQIMERLNDRYRLLSIGNRGAPNRQQTLRLCMDWSYELCTATEQELWARLSVFAGGFELDAAEIICGDGLDTDVLTDAIATLVDKSILIREEPGSRVRYKLLESLSLYGREKLLDTDIDLDLQRRHRDWYLQLARNSRSDWISPRQPEWISRLERELPNLRKAMEFCLSAPGEADPGLMIAISLMPWWTSRAQFTEGRRWITRALDKCENRPTIERVRGLSAASMLAHSHGDRESGLAMVRTADEVASAVNSAEARAFVTLMRSTLVLFNEDPTLAIPELEGAVAVFRAEHESVGEIQTMVVLAYHHGLAGNHAKEIDLLEEVLATTTEQGEYVYRCYTLHELGVSAFRRRDFTHATDYLTQSLRLCQVIDARHMAVACIEAMSWTAADQGQAQRAATLYGAAQAWQARMGRVRSSSALPRLTSDLDRCRGLARKALGTSAFEKAVLTGSKLTYEDAVAFALGEGPTAPEKSPDEGVTRLTRREREVADLVAQGLTNKAIADKLVISPRTAQGHVEHILTKLGCTSRAQIAAWIID